MTAAAAASAAELAEAVDAVQAWIDRRQRAMLAHLHACGQSPAQLHVLGLLREVAPMTVSHLAARLGISPPSASAIVDRMVDAGLVARERSEEDRRVVSVSLTPAGEAALKEAIGGRRGCWSAFSASSPTRCATQSGSCAASSRRWRRTPGGRSSRRERLTATLPSASLAFVTPNPSILVSTRGRQRDARGSGMATGTELEPRCAPPPGWRRHRRARPREP